MCRLKGWVSRRKRWWELIKRGKRDTQATSRTTSWLSLLTLEYSCQITSLWEPHPLLEITKMILKCSSIRFKLLFKISNVLKKSKLTNSSSLRALLTRFAISSFKPTPSATPMLLPELRKKVPCLNPKEDSLQGDSDHSKIGNLLLFKYMQV